jgi:hypothetical protein
VSVIKTTWQAMFSFDAVGPYSNAPKNTLVLSSRSIITIFGGTYKGFVYNLNSLATLARDMDVDLLRKLTGIDDSSKGSVQLLKSFIENRAMSSNALSTIEYLKHLGDLRQGYPTHVDTSRVLEAHTFFGFDYPIPDEKIDSAGISLLEAYETALKDLFNFIRSIPKEG